MINYNRSSELYHHGILNQKWGIRRFQNKDGTLTEAGKKRYGHENETTEEKKKRITSNLKYKEIYENRDIFSTNELNDLANRMSALNRIRDTEKNRNNLKPLIDLGKENAKDLEKMAVKEVSKEVIKHGMKLIKSLFK